VTGANAGIGFVTAKELARLGARVILACRSEVKATQAISKIQTEIRGAQLHFLSLDLANLNSIRRAAKELLDTEPRLDVLVNNAGLFGLRGTTHDGFEMHFGTNHLGPYLLTRLLLPLVKNSKDARVVIVSSHGHYSARSIDFESFRGFTRSRWSFPEYATSKLCNLLFTQALSRRLEGTGIFVCALHPGVIASDIWRNFPKPIRWLVTLPMISNEEGALTTLFCATHPGLSEQSGFYYDRCKPRQPSRLALDKELSELLWKRSAEWTGLPVEL
jgi:retinol dehydrogenase 12